MPRLAIFGSSHVLHLESFWRENPRSFRFDCPVQFIGRSGMRMDKKFDGAFKELVAFDPDVCFLIIAGNDIKKSSTPLDIALKVMAVRRKMMDAGIKKVIVGSIEMRGRTRGIAPCVYNKIRRKANKKLLGFLGRWCVDLNKVWKFPSHYAADEVHPSATKNGGCKKLLKLIHGCLTWAIHQWVTSTQKRALLRAIQSFLKDTFRSYYDPLQPPSLCILLIMTNRTWKFSISTCTCIYIFMYMYLYLHVYMYTCPILFPASVFCYSPYVKHE